MYRMIVLALVTMSLLSAAYADIAVEGVSDYSFHYNISNFGQFPDYVFLTSSAIWGWDYPQVISDGTFGGGYKLDGFVLHAILSSDLDMERLGPGNDEATNDADEMVHDYLKSLPFLTANISLPVGAFYDDKLGISNVSVILNITDLDETSFDVTKEAALFGYVNGTVIRVPVPDDEDLAPPL